ncbi:MAG TPA: type II toxin-antitoxin system mRNA interferase toxin, RelE/StbE family [Geobacter sp.]|nr:type II toxin-antitoxin system mRNA interferase toxin, RelE/StbE family [Geobacter sp.]
MIIEWLPDADLDLDEIYEFIAEDDPDAADRQIGRILGQVGKLTEKVSRKGRIGRVPETMELVITKTPFIVVYRTVPGKNQILRVLHCSQKWPKSFE